MAKDESTGNPRTASTIGIECHTILTENCRNGVQWLLPAHDKHVRRALVEAVIGSKGQYKNPMSEAISPHVAERKRAFSTHTAERKRAFSTHTAERQRAFSPLLRKEKGRSPHTLCRKNARHHEGIPPSESLAQRHASRRDPGHACLRIGPLFELAYLSVKGKTNKNGKDTDKCQKVQKWCDRWHGLHVYFHVLVFGRLTESTTDHGIRVVNVNGVHYLTLGRIVQALLAGCDSVTMVEKVAPRRHRVAVMLRLGLAGHRRRCVGVQSLGDGFHCRFGHSNCVFIKTTDFFSFSRTSWLVEKSFLFTMN